MVPAVNGGAIEGLVDTIIKENEKFKNAEFTVYSIYDGTKFEKPNYKHTKYIYIDIRDKKYKIKKLMFAIINKIPNVYIGKAYIREVCYDLKRSKERYDAVIIENNPIFSNIVSKYVKCPVILHLHNDYLNVSSKLSKKTLDSFTNILTVSDYIGNRVRTIDNNTSKVNTLYNGIDLKKFDCTLTNEDKILFRKKFRLNENDFVILYTGRIMKEKGVKELILAFNNLRKKYENIKLLIVGSSFFNNAKISNYQKELMTLCNDFKNDIIFTGYVDHNEIVNVYKISDIQVVPSLWEEPLATTVIEGMASKTPLIVNNVGGIPEMVDKNSALFCESESIISDIEKNVEKLINNEANIKQKLVDNAYDKVKIFEKSIFYNNYIDIVNKIVLDDKYER